MSKDPQKLQESILFTAFEPSGDNLAGPVIAELKRRFPALAVYAWGGPKMEEAGATLLGRTADSPAMGLSALSKVGSVRKEIRRVKRWSREYRVLAHVAVDSPAANFPICRVMKKRGARIAHLAAPQLWAWGGWRIGKLRRLTDVVLCLLPFEEQWFKDRGVPAKFIGHPRVNNALDAAAVAQDVGGLPAGSPRIAMFPGSRPHEVAANVRLLAATFTELKDRHQGMNGVIFAANPDLAAIVRKKIKVFPTGLHLTVGKAEAGASWCDMALAVSGTVTLDLAARRKPMIGVYKVGLLSWLMSKLLLRTHYRLLPNIVAGREIVPEFVPHVGGAMPIVKAATHLLHDSKNLATQSEELNRICLRFANKRPAEEAAGLLIKLLKEGRVEV